MTNALFPLCKTTQVVRFPHMSSNIHEEMKYNIVIGIFHSFCKSILDCPSFVDSPAGVSLTYIHKGYDTSHMLQDTGRCCLHHPELFGTTPLQLYEMFRQRINIKSWYCPLFMSTYWCCSQQWGVQLHCLQRCFCSALVCAQFMHTLPYTPCPALCYGTPSMLSAQYILFVKAGTSLGTLYAVFAFLCIIPGR